MTWTKDKPTSPGYYWYRRHANQDVQLLWIEWYKVGTVLAPHLRNELMVTYTRMIDDSRPLNVFDGEWQGPLDVPS